MLEHDPEKWMPVSGKRSCSRSKLAHLNQRPTMAADTTQRIARLTPIEELNRCIDALIAAVEPREVSVATATGHILAADVILPAHPAAAVALRDGCAVRSDLTTDAGAYAPLPLPAAAWIDAGGPLPAGADAIAPPDAVTLHDGQAQIISPVTPGEGVLLPGADVPASPFLRAGICLTRVRIAALAALGIARVTVREPRVRVLPARPARDGFIDAAAALVARAIAAEGGNALIDQIAADAAPLIEAVNDEETDAIVVIGGTGSGRNDASVRMLASAGRVEAHGIALSPGETSAFGMAGRRPVLILPGRLDAALAAWLVIGSRMLKRLSASTEGTPAINARLARKAASSLGLAELIPVDLREGEAEPLASGYWPLGVLAQSNGWILVAADREGYPAGAEVVVRPWP
jgi:molybdopterin biosynthesis enzyme